MKKRRTVLITGGAKRLGRDMALYLASLGYSIALHYNRSTRQAKKTAEQIRAGGADCRVFQADLSDTVQAEKLIAAVLKACGTLDVLVNNASVFEKSRLTDSIGIFDKHFLTNCKAPYILSCQFSLKCKKGHIINILDTHITKNKTDHFAYLFSKKALLELTLMSAYALGPRIRVNGIAPGLVLPPEGQGRDYLDRMAKRIALQRRGSPRDVLHALEFLLSNDYITGQVLFADGGEHLD